MPSSLGGEIRKVKTQKPGSRSCSSDELRHCGAVHNGRGVSVVKEERISGGSGAHGQAVGCSHIYGRGSEGHEEVSLNGKPEGPHDNQLGNLKQARRCKATSRVDPVFLVKLTHGLVQLIGIVFELLLDLLHFRGHLLHLKGGHKRLLLRPVKQGLQNNGEKNNGHPIVGHKGVEEIQSFSQYVL